VKLLAWRVRSCLKYPSDNRSMQTFRNHLKFLSEGCKIDRWE
jgi:hypothetical protein